jgi:hypothetical protein
VKPGRLILISAIGAVLALALVFHAQETRVFRAGAARRDITPREPVPPRAFAAASSALPSNTRSSPLPTLIMDR